MEQSPFWEVTGPTAGEEIPRILWNPNVKYRVHNRLTLIRILSHTYHIHYSPRFFIVYFNIILPSKPWSSKWRLSFRFSHRKPAHILLLQHVWRYISSLYNFSWCDKPTNICWGVEIMNENVSITEHLSLFRMWSNFTAIKVAKMQ